MGAMKNILLFYQVGSLAITMARYLNLTVNNEYDSRSGAEWDLEFSSLTNIIFVSPSLTKSLLTVWKEPGWGKRDAWSIIASMGIFFETQSTKPNIFAEMMKIKALIWMVFGAHNEFLVHCKQVRVFLVFGAHNEFLVHCKQVRVFFFLVCQLLG